MDYGKENKEPREIMQLGDMLRYSHDIQKYGDYPDVGIVVKKETIRRSSLLVISTWINPEGAKTTSRIGRRRESKPGVLRVTA